MVKRFSGSILSALLYLLLLPGPAVFAASDTTATILVLGDSLSGAYGINPDEGWVALLQQQLLSEGYEYRVVNASVSGDTTRTGLTRIHSALQAHRPSIVILALGGNDGLRGLPFSEIESSLAQIIERCRKDHVQVLLVGIRLPPNYGAEYNQQFTAIYRQLSERYDIPLVARMLDQVAEYRELLQDDGIHPKVAAQSRIMMNVWAGLLPMLEKH
ncbi:MAG: arylesterase [Gammaproteobacteria bacterium]|nr:arylesterase [Gammaproteobacteria bacterium]